MTSRRSARGLHVAASVALLVGVWSIAAAGADSIVLPSPAEVGQAFAGDVERGTWLKAVSTTLGHVAMALLLVLAVGLPVGVGMGRSLAMEDALRVPTILLQTLPTIAVAAIALIAIGTTSTGVVFVTTASALPYFTLAVVQGTREVDRGLVEMAKVYGVGEAAITRAIVLPSVVPYVLAGARVAIGVAWHVTLVAEFLMGTPAVGSAIASDIKLLDTASVFSWGLTIVALTVVVEYGVFRPAERWLRRRLGGR